jgi:hypothetical protein
LEWLPALAASNREAAMAACTSFKFSAAVSVVRSETRIANATSARSAGFSFRGGFPSGDVICFVISNEESCGIATSPFDAVAVDSALLVSAVDCQLVLAAPSFSGSAKPSTWILILGAPVVPVAVGPDGVCDDEASSRSEV